MAGEGDNAPDGSPAYNPIFESLVEGATDGHQALVGMVAYALYKKSKAEWTQSFRARRGRKPTSDELDEYILTWTTTRLDGLVSQANDTLIAFSNYVVTQEEPRITKRALQGSMFRDVRNSLLANLIYTVLLVALALVLATAGIDVVGIFQAVADAAR